MGWRVQSVPFTPMVNLRLDEFFCIRSRHRTGVQLDHFYSLASQPTSVFKNLKRDCQPGRQSREHNQQVRQQCLDRRPFHWNQL